MTGPDPALLADLDAGLLDPTHAAQVRAAALADPRAAAVLEALRATRADLAALPAPPVPPGVARQWFAALAAAERGDAAPEDPAPHDAARPVIPAAAAPPRAGHPWGGQARRHDGSRRPRARASAVTALLTAAALVVGLVIALVRGPGGAVEVTRVELAAVARSTIGGTDLGPYTEVPRRAACLATAGHADAPVLGGRRVRLDGAPGVLLVLSTGVLGRFRVLVVDDACRTLADELVGR